MGWEDRPYYRDRGTGPVNPLMWLMNGSVSLGVWFGINVRVHASLIAFVAITLILPGSIGGAQNALTAMALLFIVVLLHEFGHCTASYLVGGRPHQILMHPLGGLASADAPHRPWANFVTVMGGPLVNVLICLAAAGVLAAMAHSWSAVPWNPFSYDLARLVYASRVAYYFWWLFTISWANFLFNLWPVFPLDGGQMLQSLLWVKFGYYRATIFACVTGMIGAVIFAGLGIVTHKLLLVFLAIWGFQYCLGRYREFKAAGPYAFQDDDSPYAASLASDEGSRRRASAKAVKRNAKAAKVAQKLEREAQAEQVEIDDILAKVSALGMASLTSGERKALQRATERQRSRDSELTKARRRSS